MDITLTTPALLFPALSLLMLAYTNRFLAIATLIRNLSAQHKSAPSPTLPKQIANLRRRIFLIRNMQWLGVFSILLAVLCIFVLYEGWEQAGKIFFGASLVSLMGSLFLSLWEIQISVYALDLALCDLEESPVSSPKGA
ncbi:MAG: DUF2721 domain-containing protein [Armatimonadota bacterium]